MNFIVVNNAIIDRDKVSCLIQDPAGELRVTVYFDNGERLNFVGKEAADVWKEFDVDKKSWRDE